MNKLLRVIVGIILGGVVLLVCFFSYAAIFGTRPIGLTMGLIQAVGLIAAYWYIFPYVLQKKDKYD